MLYVITSAIILIALEIYKKKFRWLDIIFLVFLLGISFIHLMTNSLHINFLLAEYSLLNWLFLRRKILTASKKLFYLIINAMLIYFLSTILNILQINIIGMSIYILLLLAIIILRPSLKPINFLLENCHMINLFFYITFFLLFVISHFNSSIILDIYILNIFLFPFSLIYLLLSVQQKNAYTHRYQVYKNLTDGIYEDYYLSLNMKNTYLQSLNQLIQSEEHSSNELKSYYDSIKTHAFSDHQQIEVLMYILLKDNNNHHFIQFDLDDNIIPLQTMLIDLVAILKLIPKEIEYKIHNTGHFLVVDLLDKSHFNDFKHAFKLTRKNKNMNLRYFYFNLDKYQLDLTFEYQENSRLIIKYI